VETASNRGWSVAAFCTARITAEELNQTLDDVERRMERAQRPAGTARLSFAERDGGHPLDENLLRLALKEHMKNMTFVGAISFEDRAPR
jgi:hypothetical protein